MPIFPSCPLTRRVIDARPFWFGGGNSKRLILLRAAKGQPPVLTVINVNVKARRPGISLVAVVVSGDGDLLIEGDIGGLLALADLRASFGPLPQVPAA